MLPKHSFILRPVYELSNEMKFYNLTTPLPAIGGIYDMYNVNPNPNYPSLKYTKGFIGVRVTNVHNYKLIVDIFNRNEKELQFVVQDIPPPWGWPLLN